MMRMMMMMMRMMMMMMNIYENEAEDENGDDDGDGPIGLKCSRMNHDVSIFLGSWTGSVQFLY